MSIGIYNRRYTTQPPKFPSINWGHSLAEKLVGCWIFNEGIGDVHNLARNNFAGPLNENVWTDNYGTGRAISCAGSATQYISVSNRPLVGGQQDFSVVVEAQLTTDTLQVGYPGRCIYNEIGTGNNEIRLMTSSFSAGNDYFQAVYTNDAGVRDIYTGATHEMHGPIRQFALTKKSKVFNLYYDAILDGTNTYSSTDSFTDPFFFATLGHNNWIGFISKAYIYRRELSNAELQWLQVEPYAMLIQEPPRRAYSFLVLPAPSVGRNQIIVI